MTHWGVFMTMTYFGFSLYCYKNSKIHPYMHLFLELILPVEIIIGIVYWSYVYPLATIYAPLLYNISVHGGCGLFLLIEMCLNKVYLIKNHWIIAGLFNVLYTVFINMPYAFTHETPLYPLITYTNVWTYLVFLYEFVILILSYEAIRHFKQRPRVELPVYQSMTYLHRSEQV